MNDHLADLFDQSAEMAVNNSILFPVTVRPVDNAHSCTLTIPLIPNGLGEIIAQQRGL